MSLLDRFHVVDEHKNKISGTASASVREQRKNLKSNVECEKCGKVISRAQFNGFNKMCKKCWVNS